jgi:hypothetical protein
MDTYTQVPQRVFIDLLEGLSQWMAYLPKDCIKTMIHMGWDVTT